jgi:hypothetical protein
MQTLRAERDRFEKEMEATTKAMKERKEILQQGELEAQKWEDMATNKDETNAMQELVILRQEIRIIRESMITGQQTSTPLSRYDQEIFEIRDPAPPKVTFQEALETVPVYDEHNISLSQFIRVCRRAKGLIPFSSEQNLTRLLINKLRGRALSAVEDKPCSNVTELIDLLTNAFGIQKTIDQYKET